MIPKNDFEALRKAMNDATNRIAARIQALMDKRSGGGITSAVIEEEVRAALAVEVARLQALGANPENPVPENI